MSQRKVPLSKIHSTKSTVSHFAGKRFIAGIQGTHRHKSTPKHQALMADPRNLGRGRSDELVEIESS